MDWKAFIASLIGSLAWPFVVIILLVVLRKQIGGLAERLQELSLGGAKATFEKQLETAREEAEQLRPISKDAQGDRLTPPTDERRILELAQAFPEAAVIESYKRVEAILNDIGSLMEVTGTLAIADELMRRELIDSNTLKLFHNLRNARNIAAHPGDRRITPGEALDYSEQTDKLTSRLAYALGRLEAQARYEKKK